ncbi:unnamed protein product, partial [Effrenium voratum]
MRSLRRLALLAALSHCGFCDDADVTGSPPLVRREVARSDRADRTSAAFAEAGTASGQETAGIYGEAMDEGLSRFLVSSQDLSEQNLQKLEIPVAFDNGSKSLELGPRASTPEPLPDTAEGRLKAEITGLEERLSNVMEVAKVAEAAATKASALVAAQDSQLHAADEKIRELEEKATENEKYQK